jgi:predicted GNAT family acetyltransferase
MLWVHEILRPGKPAEIASIVATTRSSESVAGITKVFTNPGTRNMGCAERLVRTVCHRYGTHSTHFTFVSHPLLSFSSPFIGLLTNLTRFRINSLLRSYETVILYVAHNNPAASKVYRKVGFQGLESPKAVADGVEDWLELGFDRQCVALGHW